MAVKLTIFDRKFVPDVIINTDDGVKNNRDLEPCEQISCEVVLCTVGENQRYSSMSNVEGLVKDKCLSVNGLEEFGIKTGKDLIDKSNDYVVLTDISYQIYQKSLGNHIDDIPTDKKPDTGDGEFSEKE